MSDHRCGTVRARRRPRARPNPRRARRPGGRARAVPQQRRPSHRRRRAGGGLRQGGRSRAPGRRRRRDGARAGTRCAGCGVRRARLLDPGWCPGRRRSCGPCRCPAGAGRRAGPARHAVDGVAAPGARRWPRAHRAGAGGLFAVPAPRPWVLERPLPAWLGDAAHARAGERPGRALRDDPDLAGPAYGRAWWPVARPPVAATWVHGDTSPPTCCGSAGGCASSTSRTPAWATRPGILRARWWRCGCSWRRGAGRPDDGRAELAASYARAGGPGRAAGRSGGGDGPGRLSAGPRRKRCGRRAVPRRTGRGSCCSARSPGPARPRRWARRDAPRDRPPGRRGRAARASEAARLAATRGTAVDLAAVLYGSWYAPAARYRDRRGRGPAAGAALLRRGPCRDRRSLAARAGAAQGWPGWSSSARPRRHAARRRPGRLRPYRAGRAVVVYAGARAASCPRAGGARGAQGGTPRPGGAVSRVYLAAADGGRRGIVAAVTGWSCPRGRAVAAQGGGRPDDCRPAGRRRGVRARRGAGRLRCWACSPPRRMGCGAT